MIGSLNGAANVVVRRLGVEPREELRSVHTLEELAFLIRSSATEGTLDEQHLSLLARTIRFGGKNAADALLPRPDIVALGVDASVDRLVESSRTTGLSRFPVYEGDLDHVCGYVDVHDVLAIPPATRSEVTLESIRRDVLVVPEGRELDELLLDLRARNERLAIVIDEHGGTTGLVTFEDLLEELVGDISDEYDPEHHLVHADPRRPGAIVVDAGLHLDELEDAIGLLLPDGPYETVAGFVLDQAQRIPDEGEFVEHDGWRFEVADRAGMRIAAVRLVPPDGWVAPT